MAEQQKFMRYEQQEANYRPLSNVEGKACASCRWFDSWDGNTCRIIAQWPLDIQPTGVCDKHDPLPLPTPTDETVTETAIDAVVTAIETALNADAGDSEPDDMKAITPVIPAQRSKLLDRVAALFKRNSNALFQVFKADNGQHYWLARHTNMFKDREDEILSSASHKQYVQRVAMGLVEPPELWSFHAKGTRHGQADIVWEHEGFVFALGHFDDTPAAKKAIKEYQRRKGKIELSHGFIYPTWAFKDGVYDSYNTFEISTLPEGAAANPYTTFEEVTTMPLSKNQLDWIKSTMGEEGVSAALAAQAAAEKDAEHLKSLGTAYKDFAELEPEAAQKAAEGLEVSKTFGKVLGSVISAMAEVSDQLEAAKAEKATADKALADERKANADAIKQLSDDLAALKAQLDSRPRRVTEGAEVTGKDIPTDITDGVTQPETFFGVPLKST